MHSAMPREENSSSFTPKLNEYVQIYRSSFAYEIKENGK